MKIMREIADMQDGESAYTVPWAAMPDRQHNIWIRGDYHITSKPQGTSSMLIKRAGNSFNIAFPVDEEAPASDIPAHIKKAWRMFPARDINE